MKKKKILWFIHGAATPEQKAQAEADGLTIRNASAFSEGAGLEECDGVTGESPQAYAEKYTVIEAAKDSKPAPRRAKADQE